MTEELLHWSIEVRGRSNGVWRSFDSRHHATAAECFDALGGRMRCGWRYVRFRNTKTGEVVVP